MSGNTGLRRKARMRILFVGSSSGDGLTFHSTRLAIMLKKLGNDIVVISDRKNQYAELPDELRNMKIRHYISDYIDGFGPNNLLRGIVDIKKLHSEEGFFDIIHAGGAKHSPKVFLATKRPGKKTKTFVTILYLPKAYTERTAANLVYRLYDKYVALCNYSKEELAKSGINLNRISIIPLFAPDLDWFEKKRKKKVKLEAYCLQNLKRPIIFYAARHQRHKGFSYYLAAAARILKECNATFVVGGDGPITPYLKMLGKRLGISDHLIFTGWMSNYHMPFLLSEVADICVSTSLEEQLPSYIMECMAAKRPIVASKVGGVSELITNGENGFLVPSYDYEETARQILTILDNPDKAQKMGLNNRKKIEEQYNMKNSTLRLMNSYRESLES